MRTRHAPVFFNWPCSMMLSIDSCLASSMNPHVLMITTSASLGSSVNSNPLATSAPSMTSESTWFLEHPRLTKPMVVLEVVVFLGVMRRVGIVSVYESLEKGVNHERSLIHCADSLT